MPKGDGIARPGAAIQMAFRPTIVVPAAGRGSRFGGSLHKLQQPFDGSTVLGSTVRHALETELPVVVVTTERQVGAVEAYVDSCDIVVLDDDDAARGMGASIAAGVAERSGAPGWLVLPGDMPLVKPSTIVAVAAALEHHAVAYAQHRGRRGHPVGFGAEMFSELVHLKGDEGARRLLARYPTAAVELDDPGVLFDVDTVDDLARLHERLQDGAGSAATGARPAPAR